jgi:hypothetical protein
MVFDFSLFHLGESDTVRHTDTTPFCKLLLYNQQLCLVMSRQDDTVSSTFSLLGAKIVSS